MVPSNTLAILGIYKLNQYIYHHIYSLLKHGMNIFTDRYITTIAFWVKRNSIALKENFLVAYFSKISLHKLRHQSCLHKKAKLCVRNYKENYEAETINTPFQIGMRMEPIW